MIWKERGLVASLWTVARNFAPTAVQADTSLLNVFPKERATKMYGRTLQLKPTRTLDRFVWAWLGVGLLWILLGYQFFDQLNAYLMRVL